MGFQIQINREFGYYELPRDFLEYIYAFFTVFFIGLQGSYEVLASNVRIFVSSSPPKLL